MAAAAATVCSCAIAVRAARCRARNVRCAAMHVLRDFTAKELEFVSNFKSGELNVEAGTNILLQGTNSAHLYTVLSGWAFRYKTLPDGRRQILNYALPADLLGLQGSVNDEMQHSVEALTDMMLCVFPREKLWEPLHRLPDARVRRHLACGARGADSRREPAERRPAHRDGARWPICCCTCFSAPRRSG